MDILHYIDIPCASIRSANPNVFVKVFSNLHFYFNLIDKNTPETLKNFKNINLKVE